MSRRGGNFSPSALEIADFGITRQGRKTGKNLPEVSLGKRTPSKGSCRHRQSAYSWPPPLLPGCPQPSTSDWLVEEGHLGLTPNCCQLYDVGCVRRRILEVGPLQTIP